MNASDWLEERILNHFFRNTNTPPPTQHFIGLFISNPTDAGTGTEVQGGGYARRAIAFTAPTQVSGRGQISNNAEIRFPIATANWGTVSHFGIFTAATGGNFLAHGPVTVSKLIEAGDEAKFNINTLTISVD